MMLARYKKIANFTFLARWANLATEEITMPMIIKRIDEIARQRHSDVVFLEFFSIRDRRMTSKPVSSLFHLFEPVDWERHPSRKRILSWLTQNDIHWIPCYGPESDGFIVS